ncbi:hypothetical protein ENBRE01_0771 [Enteropsectra breve]|nr:hypothetical protein ENBRE01_0771 [Enteropsectra breve]
MIFYRCTKYFIAKKYLPIRNSYDYPLDYSDIYSSKYLANCEITATDPKGNNITAAESPVFKKLLLNVTKIYEKAADKVRDPEKCMKKFKYDLQVEAAAMLKDNTDYQTIYLYTNIVITVPTSINLRLLDRILRMRRYLYRAKANFHIFEFTDIIDLYKLLDFEEGAYSDLFFIDEKNEFTRHVLIEQNTLFAINTALSLHFIYILPDFKDVLRYPIFYSKDSNYSELIKFYDHMKDMNFLKAIISLVEIAPTDQEDVKMLDLQRILLGHGKTFFEYGLLGNEKFFLQPALGLKSEKCFRASIFSVFDRLTVFGHIEELRAVCNDSLEQGIGFFYSNLVSVLPSLRSIEVEEIESKKETKAKKNKPNDSNDDCYSTTAINSVLHELMVKNKACLKDIFAFNIKGYSMLKDDFIREVKTMNFSSFGLFGRNKIKDFFHLRSLLGEDCILKNSIREITGSRKGVFLAKELLNDEQLTKATFNLNEQDNEFPTEIFKKNTDILANLQGYFEGDSLYNEVKQTKVYPIKSMSLVHKPRMIESNGMFKLCAMDLNEIQNQEKYILNSCQANEVSTDAGFLGTPDNVDLPVSKISFNSIFLCNNMKPSLKYAVHLLKSERSKIFFKYAYGTIVDYALSHFSDCIIYMIKDCYEKEKHLKDVWIDFYLILEKTNFESFDMDAIKSYIDKRVQEAVKGMSHIKVNIYTDIKNYMVLESSH